MSEAQWAIDERDDTRKALVARWFVADRFGEREAYGVTSGERVGDEYFDVVGRYGSIAPEAADSADLPDW
ncbi:MAG: hypothetical protein V5A44_02220 [Haloarculaceae archaeon]